MTARLRILAELALAWLAVPGRPLGHYCSVVAGIDCIAPTCRCGGGQ